MDWNAISIIKVSHLTLYSLLKSYDRFLWAFFLQQAVNHCKRSASWEPFQSNSSTNRSLKRFGSKEWFQFTNWTSILLSRNGQGELRELKLQSIPLTKTWNSIRVILDSFSSVSETWKSSSPHSFELHGKEPPVTLFKTSFERKKVSHKALARHESE